MRRPQIIQGDVSALDIRLNHHYATTDSGAKEIRLRNGDFGYHAVCRNRTDHPKVSFGRFASLEDDRRDDEVRAVRLLDPSRDFTILKPNFRSPTLGLKRFLGKGRDGRHGWRSLRFVGCGKAELPLSHDVGGVFLIM